MSGKRKQVGWPMYGPEQQLIAGVTKWLNENATSTEDFYLHVELRSVHADADAEGAIAGEWSDEIAPDCWSFQQVEPAGEEGA